MGAAAPGGLLLIAGAVALRSLLLGLGSLLPLLGLFLPALLEPVAFPAWLEPEATYHACLLAGYALLGVGADEAVRKRSPKAPKMGGEEPLLTAAEAEASVRGWWPELGDQSSV